MKKKVLYGVAVALFASVTMGSLQSCKDDLSDFRHQTEYDQQVLNNNLEQLRGLVNSLQSTLNECKTNCENKISALENRVTKNENDITELKSLITQLEAEWANSEVINAIKARLTALETNLAATDANVSTIIADVVAIKTQIGQLSSDYQAKFTAIENQLTTISNNYNTLLNQVTELNTKYTTQQGIIVALQNDLDELYKNIYGTGGLSDQMFQYYQACMDEINQAKADLTDLSNKYNQLLASQTELWESIYGEGGLTTIMSQYYNANKAEIEDLKNSNTELWESIFGPGGISDQMSQYYNDNKDAIANVSASVQELWESVFGENGLTTLMSQYYNANKAEIDELKASHTELWESIYGEGGLTTIMSQYYNANKAAIEELETALNNLTGRVDKLITSILIQGTDNPIFGNFSLPIGIRSNMLFNWYGKNGSSTVVFPSALYFADDEERDQYTEIFNDLTPNGLVRIEKNEYYGDVNLGKVYMTINPVGVNFEGNKFYLETSKGEEGRLPVTITPKESNEELYFGYTRSAANGFYESELILEPKMINSAEIKLDENLKPAMKEALNNRTLRSAAHLLKTLYNQMATMLPAYALRSDWNYIDENGVSKSTAVLSQYDLAVATAKPLSYGFLEGKHFGKKLRPIGNIENFIYELRNNGNLHFDFSDKVVKFDDVTIKLPAIDISAPGNISTPTINASIGEIKVYKDGELVGTAVPPSVTVTGIENLTNEINNNVIKTVQEMVSQIKGWSDQANAAINSQINSMIHDNIQYYVDKMMREIAQDINNKIQDFITDMGDKADPYFKRINKVFDLYNRVANKVNNILENPNDYLQVAAFYLNNKKDFGVVSTVANDPTVFYRGTGDAIELYLSSYTGEFVVPAYKKYIAITGVDGNHSAAAIGNLNTNELNTVLDGSRIRVGIPTSKLVPGKTYELTYQGLDYCGMISTRKFYIVIK